MNIEGTEKIQVGKLYYCLYCGKEIKIEKHFCGSDDYDGYWSGYCDCEGALLEKELNKIEREYSEKLRKLIYKNQENIKNIQYQQELTDLKRKYGKYDLA